MRKLVPVIVLALPVVSIAILRGPLNRFYQQEEGAITFTLFLFSTYLLIGEYYYLTSEAFYLWVQRWILRFRRIHTFWRFSVAYHGVAPLMEAGESKVKEIQDGIAEVFSRRHPGKAVIRPGANFSEVTVDDLVRFNFGFDIEESRVSLTTSRLLVPSQLYESELNRVSSLLSDVERAIGPKECQYRLEITFERRNPYFGFFVRHVPQELIKQFRCVFRTAPTVGAECVIEVTQDAILVNTHDPSTLREVADKYLTLSDTLITAASGAR